MSLTKSFLKNEIFRKFLILKYFSLYKTSDPDKIFENYKFTIHDGHNNNERITGLQQKVEKSLSGT